MWVKQSGLGLNGDSTEDPRHNVSPLGGGFLCLRALAGLCCVPSTKDSAGPKLVLSYHCPVNCCDSCVCLGGGRVAGGTTSYKYRTPKYEIVLKNAE